MTDDTAQPRKKRHHYVPVSYLENFADEEGFLHIIRKDEPDHVFPQRPRSIGFRKYYYSQPLPDGGTDDDALEDFFSGLESLWPALVDRMRTKESVNDQLMELLQLVALQRVRVPASRDVAEFYLAEVVKSTARSLERSGELPPAPHGMSADDIDVAIDPHQSIHMMVQALEGVGFILDIMGFEVLANRTRQDLITSDNPVIYFDPRATDHAIKPYSIEPRDPVAELFFPVSKDLVIHGHSSLRAEFAREGLAYGRQLTPKAVARINRLVCRFAYEAVFSPTPSVAPLVKRHSGESPVLRTRTVQRADGELVLFSNEFGTRGDKPRWERRRPGE